MELRVNVLNRSVQVTTKLGMARERLGCIQYRRTFPILGVIYVPLVLNESNAIVREVICKIIINEILCSR